MKKHILFWGLILLSLQLWAQKDLETRVIIFGVDGLNTIDLMKVNTPNIDSLMARGSWTIEAKAVMPTSSSPNWASMVMGAPPELTTVWANGWNREKEYVPNPTCDSFPTFFPNLFYELHRQHPNSRIGAIHQWPDWRKLVLNDQFTKRRMSFLSARSVIRKAKRYFPRRKPELMFLHLDICDHAGHKHGHGSPEYVEALEITDKLLGELIDKLKAKGLYESTYILLISDHGGKDHGHGGDSPEEVNIPWILTGPGIKQGYQIQGLVNTYDTAPTLARILGITPNSCWTGRVVTEIFE